MSGHTVLTAQTVEDCIIDQAWERYSAEDHAIWRVLYERQQQTLKGHVCQEYLDGLAALGIGPEGVPNFEIREAAGMTDLLIRDNRLGRALAETLGKKSVALMRGHGNVCVGPNIMTAVYRAVYTEVNARLQAQAIALGGEITFMDPQECALITGRKDLNFDRPWRMWKERIGAK